MSYVVLDVFLGGASHAPTASRSGGVTVVFRDDNHRDSCSALHFFSCRWVVFMVSGLVFSFVSMVQYEALWRHSVAVVAIVDVLRSCGDHIDGYG